MVVNLTVYILNGHGLYSNWYANGAEALLILELNGD